MSIKWEYEPVTLKIYDGQRPWYYVPDFFLPEFGIYIEVKGYWRGDGRKKKFELFQQQLGPRLCLVMKQDLMEAERVL
jgi:predicted nuclease of restriction endonuclease-like RecB superfamily